MEGFDAEQQELIRSLLKKRDELMRMQEAIHRLQAMDVPRLEPASAPEEPEEEEAAEEEEYEEEEEEYENSDDPVRPRPLPRLALQLGWRQWRLDTLPPRTLPPRTLPPRTLPPRTPPPRTPPPRTVPAPALFAGGRPSGDADGEAARARAHAPSHLRAAPAA